MIIFCACLKSVEFLEMLAVTFICWQKKKTPKKQIMIKKLCNHVNETLVQDIDCSLSSN